MSATSRCVLSSSGGRAVYSIFIFNRKDFTPLGHFHPEIIFHPFNIHLFVDSGSGDIFPIHVTILDRKTSSQLDEHGGRTLQRNEQREEKLNSAAPVVASKHPEDAAVQVVSKRRR